MTTNKNSLHRTLVMAHNLAEGRAGWMADEYYTDAVCHYGEEGDGIHNLLVGCDSGVGNDYGYIYEMTGTDDGGTNFTCKVRTGSEDQGDSRYYKKYGDVALDVDTLSDTLTATIGYDGHSSTDTSESVSTASRAIYPIDPDSWTVAQDISLDLEWESSQDVKLYSWEPRWHEESAPLSAYSWETSEINFDLPGFVYSGYIYLPHISSTNLSLVFTIDGTAQDAITITHGSSSIVKTFQRLPIMKGKLWKLRISSSAEFRIAGKQAELLVKAWGSSEPWKRVPIFVDSPTSELTA